MPYHREPALRSDHQPICAHTLTDPKFDNFACVSSVAQPCDKIEGTGKTGPGVLTTYTTDFYGKRLTKQTGKLAAKNAQVVIEKEDNSQVYVKVNRDKKFQTIFGFGGAFTDATGINLKAVNPKLQELIINDYFSRDGLEYNMGRIPIGGTDFSTHGYSLDDMNPIDQEDKNLSHFALTTEDLNYKVNITRSLYLSQCYKKAIDITLS